MALRLKRNGITRIRPLQGGLNLWMTREFPIEALEPSTTIGAGASGEITPDAP